MRENILKRLTEDIKSARHAIVLTHNVDFLFVQSVVRAALRAIGSPKLTIFADAGCAREAFGRQHRVIEGLGSTYRVVPVDLGPYRRFHPKAWLLANPDRAVAAIGSGNLTFGGMSANREAWDYGATGGEGADLVAALRAYLPRIVERVPLSESILDDIRAAFSPEFAWTAGLPGPSSIAMSPGDRPLLDQIADNVAGEIRRVSVVTPFFDADGAALVELARRFRAPVTAYVQPSRAGLSRRAAEGLPTGVSVGAAAWKDDEKPSDKQEGKPSKPGNEQKKLARAIHAKVFAFHRDNDAILAVGSANCSRAALTLGSSECNAEMMAVRTVSAADAQEFLGGLELSDVTPTLPEKPHEEEEVVATGSFRIMAARQTVDVVDVAFHCAYSLFAVELETEDGLWWPAARIDAAAASFHSVSRTRVAVLIGTTADGQKLQSLPCWVDDEGSLNAPATLRRLTDRLEGSEVERGSDEYAAVLDLFRDYLRDPESGRGSPRGDRAPPKPLEYDPKTVFADGFADAMKGSGDAGPGAHSGRADAISVIAAFFHMPTHAVAPTRRRSSGRRRSGRFGRSGPVETTATPEIRGYSRAPPHGGAEHGGGAHKPHLRDDQTPRKDRRRPRVRRGRHGERPRERTSHPDRIQRGHGDDFAVAVLRSVRRGDRCRSGAREGARVRREGRLHRRLLLRPTVRGAHAVDFADRAFGIARGRLVPALRGAVARPRAVALPCSACRSDLWGDRDPRREGDAERRPAGGRRGLASRGPLWQRPEMLRGRAEIKTDRGMARQGDDGLGGCGDDPLAKRHFRGGDEAVRTQDESESGSSSSRQGRSNGVYGQLSPARS